tara:strand:- start:1324 stop:2436 length:1113 start_codon:yes stop_codon:yes gene_type:complete
MAEKLYAGEIPESILDKEIEKFHAKRSAAGGKKLPDADAQFEYNKTTYTLKLNSDHKKGVQVRAAWNEARDSANRRGRKKNQEIKLSSIEQMMVDNYYKEGTARGLHVDHDIPIDKGGPSNAPWNLKLRTKEVNLAKGNKIGGHWPSEPFLETSLNDNHSPLISTVQREKLLTDNVPEVTQERALDKAIQKADTDRPAILGELPENNGKSSNSGLAINAKDFKVGTVRLADQAINVGINLGTGNYAGAAIGGGAIAMTETLKSKAAQKAIARQIATIAAKRGGKSALKLIPGLDILLSGKESWDYLRQGKLDQAGIAALSGAIGWIPVIGDGASAALDFTNTGIDISRLDIPNRTKKKTKLKGAVKALKV